MRLPFGVFRTSTVSEGHGYSVTRLAKVICYFKDILISGTTSTGTFRQLAESLKEIRAIWHSSNKSKCTLSVKQ